MRDEILLHDTDMVVKCLKRNTDNQTVVKVLEGMKDLHVNWLCVACDVSRYADMIQCDQCDSWSHWECVGGGKTLPDPIPSPWICEECETQSKEILLQYSQTGKRPRNRKMDE